MQRPTFNSDKLLNTRELGLYIYTEFDEFIIGVAIWNRIFGLRFERSGKRSRLFSKKHNEEASRIRDIIAYLNEASSPSVHSVPNSAQSEQPSRTSTDTSQSNT